MAARSGDVEVVLHDGTGWWVSPGRVTGEGTAKLRGRQGEVALDAAVLLRPGLYVLATTPVQLAQEKDFHRSRRRLALSSLFSPAGDLVEMIRWVGWGLLVVLMFWSVQASSGFYSHDAAALGQIQGQLTSVQKTLAQPIRVQVPSGTVITAPTP